jgi:hypothetical protein
MGSQFQVSRRTVARLNRVRIVAKYRRLRRAGARFREQPRAFVEFLLGDELHTFSYQIANEDALADMLSKPLGLDAGAVRRLFAEGRQQVAETLGRSPRRFRVPVRARNLPWYAVVRALKPTLIVESGVDRGRGSVVILTALAANRREGFPGRLVSIDPMPGAGYMVPLSLRSDWRLVRSTSVQVITEDLTGQQIDLYLLDSLQVLAAEELRTAVSRIGAHFVAASSWDTPGIRAELAAVGATVIPFTEKAIHPVFPGGSLLFGFVDGSSPT